MTVSDLTERELIAHIRRHLPPAPPWVTIGIGDDAAVVEPPRNLLEVLTVDASVEGVHFDRRFTPPDAVGHRALAVNLSDLAAMGATPRVALLSLMLPSILSCDDFDQMIAGLAALARRENIHVVGGNLTRSPGPLVLDVTVTGSAKRRGVLKRSGARPGDEIYVTGTIGAARAGLQALQEGRVGQVGHGGETDADGHGPWSACISRYRYPQPRLRMGELLGRNRAATACMDLSDGLADGVRQVAEASGVGAVIDPGTLPIDPDALRWLASRGSDPLEEAVAGGDDYELLFTASPKLRGRLRAPARHGGVPFTRIGVCTPEPGVRMRGTFDGRPIDAPLPEGYRHFS